MWGTGLIWDAVILVEITPVVLSWVLILNGIGGVAFGCLYWKKI